MTLMSLPLLCATAGATGLEPALQRLVSQHAAP